MTSVLSAITKLPRFVKILSTNGLDRTNAVVLNDKDKKQIRGVNASNHYKRNRELILEKKRAYNSRPDVKKRSKEYHHNYYLIHKQEIYKKHKEYLRNKKNGTLLQMSQVNS